MQTLAQRVQDMLPGCAVTGTTLAAPGRFEAALRTCDAPVIFPFFMADGWFVQTQIPKRVRDAGATHGGILTPLGCLPGTVRLCIDRIMDACATQRLEPSQTTILLAAHGSAVSPTSARSTYAAAAQMRAQRQFRDVTVGFVEEPPFLTDVMADLEGPSLCLPFFALLAGHVTQDIPDAVSASGYSGTVLPPIGTHPAIPALIATQFTTHVPMSEAQR